MRRFFLLLGAVVLAAVGAGVSHGATPRAEQVHISVNSVFVDPDLSAECGFDVAVSFIGDVHVTVIRNKAGLVVREIDRAGGVRVTFSSANGSFSFPSAPAKLDYGSGAQIGSTVIGSFSGLQGHIPGVISSDAGLVRVEGTVIGFDELGIPMVDFDEVEPFKDVGHRNSGEDVVAAICSTLS
jgi:hypothetical protein